MRVEYHPAVEGELREITEYYNKCANGLGDEFLNEFERHVLKIVSMPTRWVAVDADVRRSLMNRFPYVIYFRILENCMLRVTVVNTNAGILIMAVAGNEMFLSNLQGCAGR